MARRVVCQFANSRSTTVSVVHNACTTDTVVLRNGGTTASRCPGSLHLPPSHTPVRRARLTDESRRRPQPWTNRNTISARITTIAAVGIRTVARRPCGAGIWARPRNLRRHHHWRTRGHRHLDGLGRPRQSRFRRSHAQQQQPEADRDCDPQFPRCFRRASQQHILQGRQTATELAGSHSAVHRARSAL